ncbi:ribonuclease toxin immunity protein CdiI [Leclercia adecarboxylata]|uniref:ribonuclease toxin immunity protein CdiI n=1 Tax=Leclercia adecarboxylata TaxID=83655 RepID=UPI002DBEAF90|nr:ribonuclease toxin immunity protein CdiI [Leclercia adecarboxylata]MEB6380849.1 ribonuclease toxin immunity protein CdiI [Leclercia adecarboxylata]
MNEYLFEKIDYEHDHEWVLKSFFNSLHLQNRFIYGIDNIIERHGFVINETYCHYPDLQDIDPEFHFDGIMFGVWDGEIIVPESVGFKYIYLACEKYLQLHPEDTDKVKALLAKIPS